MNWYKIAQEIYRGDSGLINVQDFDPEYGTRELGKQQGSSAAWGPGIYFTDQKDIAQMYGPNITKKILHNAKILTKQSPLFTYQQINKILNEVNQEIKETAISNWDENYNKGEKMLIQSIINIDNPLDQLMGIWADVFNHQNSNIFMELMVKNGIDGIAITKEDATYYVIYNRNVLQ